MEDPLVAKFREGLRSALSADIRSLVVRVMLDESSSVQGMCAGGVEARGSFKARANLSRRHAEFAAMGGGPACLAGHRLDFNRRAAKLAQIKQFETACGTGDCNAYESTWLLLYRVGVQEPIVFGAPEVLDPPAPSAPDTLAKCDRESNHDKRLACIIGEGWELLD